MLTAFSGHKPLSMNLWASIMNSRPVSIFLYLVVMWLIVQLAVNGAASMGYNWQWYRIPQYILAQTHNGIQPGELVTGLVRTVDLTVRSFLLAMALGLVVALLRLSSLAIGVAVATGFLEFIRNLPLLVLLYLIYYVCGPVFGLDRYTASIVCLAVYHSVLISEIFRAGILAVSAGQWEAAQSIGMSRTQSYCYIILPQSIRFVLPPLTGEAVHLIKSSAIVSVIAVAELTTMGRNIISDTFMSFEVWLTVAAIYLVMTLILSIFVTQLEQKFSVASR